MATTREQSFTRPGTGIQSVSILDPSKMNSWGRPTNQGHLQLPSQGIDLGGADMSMAMPDTYGDFGSPADGGGFLSGISDWMSDKFGTTKTDAAGNVTKQGGWTNAASAVADIGQVGLGVYSAMEQSKMNEFMKGYYGEEMARTKTDFANVARSSNEALASRQQRVLSAQGDTTGTDANREGVAAYMDEWGAQETF